MEKTIIWIIFSFNLWYTIELLWIHTPLIKKFKKEITDERLLKRRLFWAYKHIVMIVTPTIMGFYWIITYG